MKFKLNKILLTSCFFGAALVIAPTATLLSSCSSEIQTNQIVMTNKQYSSNESEQLTKTYSFPKYSSTSAQKEKSGDVTTQASVQKLYDNAKQAKAELEKFKTSNGSSLGVDEQIWLDSYITQWDIKIKNIEAGLIYLGADPISGSRMLSSRANSIANNIKDAINIYDLNEETGDPDTTKPNESLIKNINSKIDDAIVFINSIQGFLTDGMKLQIMPSQLTKKSFIKQTVQFFYQDLVDTKLPSTATSSIKVTDLFTIGNNTVSSNKYFTQAFKAIYDEQAKKIGFTNNEIDAKLNALSVSLDKFMNFYCGDYWKAAGSYGGVPTNSGSGENQQPTSIPELTLSRQNSGSANFATNPETPAVDETKEVEQTLTLKDDKEVYGLGYSTQDLKTKGIGLGYMTPKEGAKSLSGKAYSGNDIYQQMLYNNNSVNKTAQEIYNTGISLTSSGTTKMKTIASNVIKDIYKEADESSFNPTIWYTADPFKIKPQQKTINDILTPSETPKAGDANSPSTKPDTFTKFNVWLNQEDFFFGREKITDISDYWIQNTPQIEKYKNIIKAQGYEEKWSKKPNIDVKDGKDVTVSGDQALAGAVLSLVSYTQFKDSTSKSYGANFNSIADYVLSPYNFDIREDIGVGLEGPRGSKQFQYNCDPYYGLPKWSVASLTTHEGAMGHHTQQEYWTEYMPGTSGGKVLNDDATPGYSFVNDAYHEGWAVFTEWFAAELGTYGTWGASSKYDGNTVPTDWTHNTSTILNIKDPANPTNEEIAFIRNYQGGTYWQLVSNMTSSDGNPLYTSYADIAVAATKLANMLAYYGFLNESQLRNMRMALDTAVHYKGLTVANDALGQGGGASIQDERDFMKKNSGLGAGDISSESIRYLSIPSQATGYMLGKQIINDLYTKFKTKVQNTNKSNANYDFVIDGKNDIKSLFDLMLRNGEIPLQVLIDVVTKQFGL